MSEITITAETLLYIMGSIITIGGATAVIGRWMGPCKKARKTLEQHTQLLAKDKTHLDEVDEYNQVMGKCMLALLHHEITGNDIKKLESAKAELQDYLLRR